MTDKKNFLLVHGSWHNSKCWDRVVNILSAQGHGVNAIDLPGRVTTGMAAWKITLEDHADAIVAAAKKEDGKLVLVGHSMGGLMISRAAEKAPECFERLVYLSAFLPRNGDSLLSLSGKDKKSLVPTAFSMSLLRGKTTLKSNAAEVFYNDLTPEDIELATSHLVSEPGKPTMTKLKLSDERFGSVPRAYISCTEDLAITLDHQKYMIERQPCEPVATLNASHSPFYSMPDELVKVLFEVSA